MQFTLFALTQIYQLSVFCLWWALWAIHSYAVGSMYLNIFSRLLKSLLSIIVTNQSVVTSFLYLVKFSEYLFGWKNTFNNIGEKHTIHFIGLPVVFFYSHSLGFWGQILSKKLDWRNHKYLHRATFHLYTSALTYSL